jgi:hypothetical protein
MTARHDVTEAEMRLRNRAATRFCPDCNGLLWWPFVRCLEKVPLERELGTDDGVVEYVRECPREGRGPA